MAKSSKKGSRRKLTVAPSGEREGQFTLDRPKAAAMHVPPSRQLDSFMMQTNGGATLEKVEGFNYHRAQNRGLPFFPADSVASLKPENTIGTNDLVPIADTTMLPWRCIAYLDIRYQNGGRATGTAWFIGPRTLATAGHNLYYHHPSGGHASTIYVSPGFDGVKAPFGTVAAQHVWAPPAWYSYGAIEQDYGVIILPDNRFGPSLGWFGIADYSTPPTDTLAQISGYAEYSPRTQYYMGGRLSHWSADFVEYTFDTEIGMSGAPLFLKNADNRTAIGIHTYGDVSYNKSRRLSGAVYDELYYYAKYDP